MVYAPPAGPLRLLWLSLLFAPLLIFETVFAQFPAKVDSVYTFIKYNSVHRLEVDWRPIDSSFVADINSASTLDDTMRCFVSVLRALNDVHSQIFLNGQYYGHYPSFDDSTLAWLRPLNERANNETNSITSSILDDQLAYLRVPGMNAWNQKVVDSLAQQLQRQLRTITISRAKGVILDLRLNGGGNVYPMLTGLSALLGDGVVGFETTPDDSVARVWEIQHGNFVIGGYQTTDLAIDTSHALNNIPVAVLIGPITKSSGSATAIAFKGRPNTIFIGESTADGYSTSNGYFQFAPNLMMNFATTFVADRNKVVYRRAVEPDQKIEKGDQFDNLQADAKVVQALKWLSEQEGK